MRHSQREAPAHPGCFAPILELRPVDPGRKLTSASGSSPQAPWPVIVPAIADDAAIKAEFCFDPGDIVVAGPSAAMSAQRRGRPGIQHLLQLRPTPGIRFRSSTSFRRVTSALPSAHPALIPGRWQSCTSLAHFLGWSASECSQRFDFDSALRLIRRRPRSRSGLQLVGGLHRALQRALKNAPAICQRRGRNRSLSPRPSRRPDWP